VHYRVTTQSVGSNLGSRNNVALEVVVDIGGVAGVSGLDVAGNLGDWAGLS
jgi:hypothetical protein